MKKIVKNWLIPPGYLKLFSTIRNRPVKILANEDRDLLKNSRIIENKHHSKRCFILGAGSSIKKQDLTQLIGEHILSVSNTFVHPDFEKDLRAAMEKYTSWLKA